VSPTKTEEGYLTAEDCENWSEISLLPLKKKKVLKRKPARDFTNCKQALPRMWPSAVE
jgi:hypothetical protein